MNNKGRMIVIALTASPQTHLWSIDFNFRIEQARIPKPDRTRLANLRFVILFIHVFSEMRLVRTTLCRAFRYHSRFSCAISRIRTDRQRGRCRFPRAGVFRVFTSARGACVPLFFKSFT